MYPEEFGEFGYPGESGESCVDSGSGDSGNYCKPVESDDPGHVGDYDDFSECCDDCLTLFNNWLIFV